MSARRWSQLTLAAALITAAVLALAPITSTESCEASSQGTSECTSSHDSLLTQEGAGILVVLAVPAIIAAVPVVMHRRRTRMTAAIVLTAAAVTGIMTVGIFLLPTVLLAWRAATVDQDGARPSAASAVSRDSSSDSNT
jgi:hypothetical protein